MAVRAPINANPVPYLKVRWEEPPELREIDTSDDGHTWYERLMPVRKRQRQWAVIRTYDSKAPAVNAVSNLRFGLIRKPLGQWEFRAAPRVVATDAGYGLIWGVYARFLTKYVPTNNGKH